MKRSVIIFGGSKGIGRILTEYFSGSGDEVTVAARKSNELTSIVSNLIFQAYKINMAITDISKIEQVEDAFDSHIKTYGRIPQIVINTAALQGPIGRTWEVDPALWEETLVVNLMGSHYILNAAIRHMKGLDSGTVILFSGGGAVFPRPNFSAYGVSKTGVLRLVETVSEELKQSGINNITIHAIAPGAVYTDMTREILSAGESAGVIALKEATDIHNNGGTPPEQIISLIEFLTVPKQAKPLNGRLIHVREDYIKYVQENGEDNTEDNTEDAGKLRRIPLT